MAARKLRYRNTLSNYWNFLAQVLFVVKHCLFIGLEITIS